MTTNDRIKVTKDGFVWRILTPSEAIALWKTNAFDIYHLDSDEIEHLLESEDDFNEVIDDCIIAIEVGFAKD